MTWICPCPAHPWIVTVIHNRPCKQSSQLQLSIRFTPSRCLDVFNTIFVSSHMYPENPEGTRVIAGSMKKGYVSDTARNRTHNLFRPKCAPIPLGHSDGGTGIQCTTPEGCRLGHALCSRSSLIEYWHPLGLEPGTFSFTVQRSIN